MMFNRRLLAVALAVTVIPLQGVTARVQPVGPREGRAWIRHLLPLPHEIAFTSKVVLKSEEIGLRVPPSAGEIERQAVEELRQALGVGTGTASLGEMFEIVVGVLDNDCYVAGVKVSNAMRLKDLPHCEQAYLIEPQENTRLVVAGLHSRGVYHGVTTLIQLLSVNQSPDRVEVPLVEVTDWPDLDERGLWNNDLRLIPWLASLKINFAIDPVSLSKIERGKPVTTNMRVEALEMARPRAVQFVPHLPHYNFLHRYGVHTAYPEIVGKGESAKCPYKFATEGNRAPCASNPLLSQITAEAMEDCVRKGAQEISVWGSEHVSQCECEECLRLGQFRTETNAAVAAWRRVREKYPQVKLRIFYCMGGKSFEDTYDCLKALPPEVKVERCYGAFKDAFDKCAEDGRWVGSYSAGPSLYPRAGWIRFWGGWIRNDIKDQYDHKYQAKYLITSGTAATTQAIFNYNISALAEWSWNLHGRDPREFARAWAVRQGYERPEQVADWIACMDPIESDLARGALLLYHREWDTVAKMLTNRTPLRFGTSCLLTGFGGVENFPQRIAECKTALKVAETTGCPDLVRETRYVISLIQAIRSLYFLTECAARGDPGQENNCRQMSSTRDEFRHAVETMILLLNERTDMTDADKAAHAATWQKRLEAISNSVARILNP